MGAFGAFLIGLFSLCFRKLKTKEQTKTRIIILIAAAAILAIIVWAVGDNTGWEIYGVLALLFGWRLIADIVRYITNKFEPTNETEQNDKQATNATDESTPSQDDKSEEK